MLVCHNSIALSNERVFKNLVFNKSLIYKLAKNIPFTFVLLQIISEIDEKNGNGWSSNALHDRRMAGF